MGGSKKERALVEDRRVEGVPLLKRMGPTDTELIWQADCKRKGRGKGKTGISGI
jgi:hypothetical protein